MENSTFTDSDIIYSPDDFYFIKFNQKKKTLTIKDNTTLFRPLKKLTYDDFSYEEVLSSTSGHPTIENIPESNLHSLFSVFTGFAYGTLTYVPVTDNNPIWDQATIKKLYYETPFKNLSAPTT